MTFQRGLLKKVKPQNHRFPHRELELFSNLNLDLRFIQRWTLDNSLARDRGGVSVLTTSSVRQQIANHIQYKMNILTLLLQLSPCVLFMANSYFF